MKLGLGMGSPELGRRPGKSIGALKSGQAAASVQSHSVTVPSATPVAPEAARARWKYLEVCVTLAINRFTRKPAQNSRGFQIVLAGPR